MQTRGEQGRPHATELIALDTYSHAIPAPQEEEAVALIARLVFAEKWPSRALPRDSSAGPRASITPWRARPRSGTTTSITRTWSSAPCLSAVGGPSMSVAVPAN